jgi:sulfite exporter TauE/SafE
MSPELTLLAALVAGLLGSTHCLAMCGGIAGAMTMGIPEERRTSWQILGYVGLYNIGRVASYAIAGAIAGGIGLWLGSMMEVAVWSQILRWATGALLVAIGLQVALNWRGLRHLEALGGRFWRRLAPLARRLMPARNPAAALALGALWGWLPCGLVYSVLVVAAVSGGPLEGSALMAAFGVGTMPAMVATGTLAGRLRRYTADRRIRRAAGMLVVAFGLWTLLGPGLMHTLGAPMPHPGASAH